MNAEHNGPMTVEDDIDATLKMLGETQPPAEIVTRVHQRHEAAAMSQRARSGRVRLIPVAGIAMATLAIFAVFIQMQRTQKDQASGVQTARVVANTPLAQVTGMPSSATVETERANEGKRLVQFHTKRRSRQSRAVRHVTNLLSYPLTRQEKLLLRFVQTAKPEDLRDLNPEYQAKVEAQQEAEFDAYLKSGSGSSTKETAS
jgi:hypothetical protein